MISKILITLGVIVACMLMLSSRAKPQLKRVESPEAKRTRKMMRNAAFAFMGLMVVAASLMIYFEVDSQNEVVTVEVINSQSGDSRSYRVRKNDLHSDGFTTTDGLQVFVADVERIEIKSR